MAVRSRPQPTQGEKMVLDRLILEALLGQDGQPMKYGKICEYVRAKGGASLARFAAHEIYYLCDQATQALKRAGKVTLQRGGGWLRVSGEG